MIYKRRVIKVNSKNFHKNTYAKFKNIKNEKLVKELLSFTSNKIGSIFKIKKDIYRLNFKSISSYYFIKNNDTLVRISDHWSNSIGWIKSCYWEIGYLTAIKGRFTAGIIKFDKMKSVLIILQKKDWIDLALKSKLEENYDLISYTDDDNGAIASLKISKIKEYLKPLIFEFYKKQFKLKKMPKKYFIDYRGNYIKIGLGDDYKIFKKEGLNNIYIKNFPEIDYSKHR